MKKGNKAIVVFRNDEGKFKHLVITFEQLLDKTSEDFYDMLEDTEPCASSSCNNESQNFCDCGSNYEDYEIVEVLFS